MGKKRIKNIEEILGNLSSDEAKAMAVYDLVDRVIVKRQIAEPAISTFLKAKDYRKAAHIAEAVKMHDKAVDFYLMGKEWIDFEYAIHVAADNKLKKRLSQLVRIGIKWSNSQRCSYDHRLAYIFERIEDWKRAAQYYEKTQDYEKAAEAHINAGSKTKAISLFEKANEFFRAGWLAQDEGLLERAYDNYVKAKQPVRAAEIAKKMEKWDLYLEQSIENGSWHDACSCAHEHFGEEKLKETLGRGIAHFLSMRTIWGVDHAIGLAQQHMAHEKILQEIYRIYDFATSGSIPVDKNYEMRMKHLREIEVEAAIFARSRKDYGMALKYIKQIPSWQWAADVAKEMGDSGLQKEFEQKLADEKQYTISSLMEEGEFIKAVEYAQFNGLRDQVESIAAKGFSELEGKGNFSGAYKLATFLNMDKKAESYRTISPSAIY